MGPMETSECDTSRRGHTGCLPRPWHSWRVYSFSIFLRCSPPMSTPLSTLVFLYQRGPNPFQTGSWPTTLAPFCCIHPQMNDFHRQRNTTNATQPSRMDPLPQIPPLIILHWVSCKYVVLTILVNEYGPNCLGLSSSATTVNVTGFAPTLNFTIAPSSYNIFRINV